MNVEDQLRFIEARRYISSPRGLERTTDHNDDNFHAEASMCWSVNIVVTKVIFFYDFLDNTPSEIVPSEKRLLSSTETACLELVQLDASHQLDDKTLHGEGKGFY